MGVGWVWVIREEDKSKSDIKVIFSIEVSYPAGVRGEGSEAGDEASPMLSCAGSQEGRDTRVEISPSPC